MEDRRGQSSVGGPAVNTSAKCSNVPAPPEAMTGIGTAWTQPLSFAVEPGLGPIAIDRREQDLAGAAVGGLARPFDGVAVVGSVPLRA